MKWLNQSKPLFLIHVTSRESYSRLASSSLHRIMQGPEADSSSTSQGHSGHCHSSSGEAREGSAGSLMGQVWKQQASTFVYTASLTQPRLTTREIKKWSSFERRACILSIVKQITSPGWMHETSARAWCTGKTQRNRVEREVGMGIGMGNTCNSMADSCQCMTKPTTIL